MDVKTFGNVYKEKSKFIFTARKAAEQTKFLALQKQETRLKIFYCTIMAWFLIAAVNYCVLIAKNAGFKPTALA